MIYGIGCDLDTARMAKKPRRPPWLHLCGQGLRPGGQEALGLSEKVPFPSAPIKPPVRRQFAQKEAFLKAAGTMPCRPLALCEIEAVRLESGAPEYRFSGGSASGWTSVI